MLIDCMSSLHAPASGATREASGRRSRCSRRSIGFAGLALVLVLISAVTYLELSDSSSVLRLWSHTHARVAEAVSVQSVVSSLREGMNPDVDASTGDAENAELEGAGLEDLEGAEGSESESSTTAAAPAEPPPVVLNISWEKVQREEAHETAAHKRRSKSLPSFSPSMLWDTNVSAIVQREVSLATALGLPAGVRATAARGDLAKLAGAACFKPPAPAEAAPGNVSADAMQEHWSLYRVAAAMVAGDPHLAVYQNVFIGSQCRPSQLNASHIVIATHMTVDRMPQLLMVIARWQGCVSVAILACESSSIAALRKAIAHQPLLQKWAVFHVVLGASGLYPFNIMRNVALEPWQRAFDSRAPLEHRAFTAVRPHAMPWRMSTSCTSRKHPRSRDPLDRWKTSNMPWLFTMDVDSLPSTRMSEVLALLRSAVDVKGRGWSDRHTFFAVLPYESTSGGSELFKTLARIPPDASAKIAREWIFEQVRHHRARVFHSNYVPRAYLGRTPLAAWLVGKGPVLGADYIVHHEPYFIAKPPFPRFDEFFRGRGYSKSGYFVAHCVDGEYDIAVLGSVFLFSRTDFDSHHDKHGHATASGKSRRENSNRMTALIADAIQGGRVCHKFESDRAVRLVNDKLRAARKRK